MNSEARVPQHKEQFEVVLRGSTFNPNIGDRLMWTVAGALLRDLQVTRSYRFDHWDRRFDAVPNPRRVDAVFDLGNVYYCDCWPRPVSNHIRRSIKFNRAFRRATIAYLPCSWGPYRRQDRPLINQLTRDAIIFARDHISLDYLHEALGSERAIFCPDLALMCQAEQPDAGARLLGNLGLSTREPLLGLIPNVRCVEEGVTPLSDRSIYRGHLQRVMESSREIGYQVVGISHMVDTDRDRKLLAGLGVPIVESNSPSIIRSVIANLSVAVCSRYHGLVNCLVHGVPVVSLGWQHKYRGLMQDFQLSEFDHPLERSSGHLSDRLLELATSRDRLAKHIGERLKLARSEILTGMGALSSRLGGTSSVLTAPVTFDNAEIETLSHVRLSKSKRLMRQIKRLVT